MERRVFDFAVHRREHGVLATERGELGILRLGADRDAPRRPGVPSLLQQGVVQLPRDTQSELQPLNLARRRVEADAVHPAHHTSESHADDNSLAHPASNQRPQQQRDARPLRNCCAPPIAGRVPGRCRSRRTRYRGRRRLYRTQPSKRASSQRVSGEIHDFVTTIAEGATRGTATMHQIVTATEQTAAQLSRVDASTHHTRERAEMLDELLGVFRVEGTVKPTTSTSSLVAVHEET
jgi:hypothetical protein